MTEDMESLSSQFDLGFQWVDVKDAHELVASLRRLAEYARQHRMRPLLHLDMHGCKERGLQMSATNDYVSWDCLAGCLRELNTYTGNNLCLIGAACYGLSAVMSIKLTLPAPFFVLLAPETEVTIGFLETHLVRFYKELFETGNLEGAFRRNLSEKFSYVHCEKILFQAVARYIKESCTGKSARERREFLLSEVFLQGMPKTQENLRAARRKIKAGIRPDQEMLDQYAKIFLINKPCSFNIEQLLTFLGGDTTQRFQPAAGN